MNPKFVYCIECGESAEIRIDPIFGELHGINLPIRDDRGEIIGTDHEVCYFPGGYAYCPPPKEDPNWIDHAVEPGKFLPDQYSQYDLELELKQELVA